MRREDFNISTAGEITHSDAWIAQGVLKFEGWIDRDDLPAGSFGHPDATIAGLGDVVGGGTMIIERCHEDILKKETGKPYKDIFSLRWTDDGGKKWSIQIQITEFDKDDNTIEFEAV